MTTAIALLAAVPMQLAAAAGLELAGGYDSTVLNLRSLEFGDGVISRAAVDGQLGHRTESFRQVLRARGEFYFTSGEGRDIGEGDLVGLARYSMRWDSDDDRWHLEGEGSYVAGRTSLLLGRASSPDLVFQRGLYGEATGNLDLTRNFGERLRLTTGFRALDRHALDIPAGAVRNNLTSLAGSLTTAGDVSEKNTLELAARGEGFRIDFVDGWLARVTGFGGIRRRWNENLATFVLGGVDTLQDENDRSEFLIGPYAHAGLGWAQPEDGIALSVDARYEYAIIATTRCAGPTRPGMPCAVGRGGGVGRVGGIAFNMLFRPDEGPWVFTGSVQADYGLTNGVDARANAIDIENLNLNAGASARWIANRHLGVFARYDFFWSYLTAQVPTDIVRHVAMLGIMVSTSAGDGPTEPLIPLEEFEAFAGLRAAGMGDPRERSTGSQRARDPYDDDDANTGDPMGAGRLSEEEIQAQMRQQFDAQGRPRTPDQQARPDGSPPRNGPVTPTNPVEVYRRGGASPQPDGSHDEGGGNDAAHEEAPR